VSLADNRIVVRLQGKESAFAFLCGEAALEGLLRRIHGKQQKPDASKFSEACRLDLLS
jgi:hypothetical protein